MTKLAIEKDWPIIGNKSAVDFLKKNIQFDKISQAYLFVGPKQVGKKTVANFFSKTIFCQNKASNNFIPCDNCVNCDQLEKRIHADFFTLAKTKDKKNISVESIRLFQHEFNTTSLLGKIKIGLIDDADDLSESAANALLKTIEEPPIGKSIIILIAESLDSLPDTIISRCRTLLFYSVPYSEIEKNLEQMGCSKEKAEKIASISFGKPGRAIEYFKHPILFQNYEDELKEFIQLFQKGIPDKFDLVKKYLAAKNYSEKIKKTKDIIDLWITLIRDLILLKIDKANLLVNRDWIRKINENTSKYTFSELKNNLNMLVTFQKTITNNSNPQLALENYLLNLK